MSLGANKFIPEPSLEDLEDNLEPELDDPDAITSLQEQEEKPQIQAEIPFVEPEYNKTKEKIINSIRDGFSNLVEGIAGNYLERTQQTAQLYETIVPERVKRFVYETGTIIRNRPFERTARTIVERNCPDGVEFEMNENWMSISQVITAGITMFQDEHPDVDIHWPDDGKRVEVSKLLALPKSAMAIDGFEQSYDPRNLNIDEIVLFIKNMAEDSEYYNLLNNPRASRHIEYAGGHKDGQYEQVIGANPNNWVLSHIKHKRVTPEQFLMQALEATNGNLRLALQIAAIELKTLVRPDEGRLFDAYGQEHRDKYRLVRQNLVDRFSVFTPFNKLPEEEPILPGKKNKENEELINYDYSCPNQMGTAYHAMHIATLLGDFSPEVLNLLVSGEYLKYFKGQGLAKLVADTRVLADLYNVQEIIEQYKTTAQSESEIDIFYQNDDN